MKRSEIKPRSKKRARDIHNHPAIRRRVFERDGGCLAQNVAAFGPCFGKMTPHHILKESQGGSYTEDNLITLCAHHNDLIEANAEVAAAAHARGWVQKSWEAS